MKKYISTVMGHAKESTASASQNMTALLAKQEGYEEVKFYPHVRAGKTEEEVQRLVNYELAVVNPDSLFILQVPTWGPDLEYDKLYLEELRKKVEKLVIFVHDFFPLMFENNLGYTEWLIEQYNAADLIILPSRKMEDWLRTYGLTPPVLIQSLWDHYSPLSIAPQSFYRGVKFSGNPEKFNIIDDWPKETLLDIYALNKDKRNQEGIRLHDFLPDEALLLELNKGGFGLVWAENTPNMPTKDYSTMCHSYKLSTYLAAGIPVLVQAGMTAANFITQNGLGYAVQSLEEASQIVRDISEEEYLGLQKNIIPVSQMVREGFFFKKLLLEIEKSLFLID